MLLFPFQYNYVDFKFFPARDAGAEVKVFVREFSVIGPDAAVTIAGGNNDAGFLLFIPRPGTVPES